jgi:hypothetical protein
MQPASRYSLGTISLLAGLVIGFVPATIFYKYYTTQGDLGSLLWPIVAGSLFALVAVGLIWKGIFYLCASDEAILRYEQRLREVNLEIRNSFVRQSFTTKRITDDIDYFRMFALFALGSLIAVYAALSSLALGRFSFRDTFFERGVISVIGSVPSWFHSLPQVPEDWAMVIELGGGVLAAFPLLQMLFYLPQRIRYGRSEILFERYPLMLGEVAHGKFRGRWLDFEFDSIEAAITLAIPVKRSDLNSRRRGRDHTEAKETRMKVIETWPATLKRPVAGLDSYLPFEIVIEPNSEIEGYIMGRTCLWELKLHAQRPGLDFRRTYRVKVALNPESKNLNADRALLS